MCNPKSPFLLSLFLSLMSSSLCNWHLFFSHFFTYSGSLCCLFMFITDQLVSFRYNAFRCYSIASNPPQGKDLTIIIQSLLNCLPGHREINKTCFQFFTADSYLQNSFQAKKMPAWLNCLIHY